MKLYSIAAASVAALLAVTAFAGIDEAQMAEFESECKRYAVEDGIPADEVEEFLSQCVQDMVHAQSMGDSEPAEGEAKE